MHVAGMQGERNTKGILVGTLKEKGPLGRP